MLTALAAGLIVGDAIGFSARPSSSQTTGGFIPGQTLTASGLNQAFSAKLDYPGALTNMTGTQKGAIAGSCPATGQVGECGTASLARASAVSLTTATAANVITHSFAAGNWRIDGWVCFDESGGTSAFTGRGGWISSTSATLPTAPVQAFVFSDYSVTALGTTENCVSTGTLTISLSSATSLYLGAFANFTGATKAYGIMSWVRVS